MSQLDNLSLNRMLYTTAPRSVDAENSPFQGIQPGTVSGNVKPYGSENIKKQSSGLQTGSVVTNSLIRSSQGGQQRTVAGIPFGNGRVEINQGFKDTANLDFPFDSLTAFDEKGRARVVIWYNGILLLPDAFGLPPVISYLVGTESYFQPIFFGAGRVNSNGTPNATNFPILWTSAQTATGKYTITPSAAFPNANYSVTVSPVNTTPVMLVIASTLTTEFEVWAYDDTGTLVDTEFSFSVFTSNG